ncbi:MAG TPA: phage portal protein, partial [Gemmataceae bacterium]|nr:phage portal protein [Gemmataceae bacterium]
RLRASARLICTLSTLAGGALRGLRSYVVGEGFTWRASARDDSVPKELVGAVQAAIDDFSDANEWPELQQELFMRSRRDGEYFLRNFDDSNGTLVVRTVEPEQVLEPVNYIPDTDSFGVFNDIDDLQTITGFWVSYDGDSGNGEEVDAQDMVHVKCNVDRMVKRGLTDFSYDAYDNLKSAGRLLENMTEGGAIQASIALLRQHEGSSSSVVSDFVTAAADYQQTNVMTGATQNVERFYPGKIVDAPKGMQITSPAFGTNPQNFVSVLQASLRAVAVRWNAPEWLVSGDASNNNYSSSITAESPFVKTCKCEQRFYGTRYRRTVWDAVRVRCEAGRLRAGGRTYTYEEVRALVDIQGEPPTIEVRNKQEEASTNATYVQARVKSVQTTQQELGLDSDQEARNIEEWDERFGGQGQQLPMPGQAGADGEGSPFDQGGQTGQSGADSTSELRASVGGSQALLSLQTSVYKGEVPREAAIANAQIVFGFSAEQAAALFPDVPPQKTADDGQAPGPGGNAGTAGVPPLSSSGQDDSEGGQLPSPFTEAVHRDRRGHKYCTDDSTGKRTGCGDPKAHASNERNQKAPLTVKRAHNAIANLKAQDLSPAQWRMAFEGLVADLNRMTKAELTDLKKSLNLEGSGTKAVLARKVADRAIHGIEKRPRAEKPAAKGKAPEKPAGPVAGPAGDDFDVVLGDLPDLAPDDKSSGEPAAEKPAKREPVKIDAEEGARGFLDYLAFPDSEDDRLRDDQIARLATAVPGATVVVRRLRGEEDGVELLYRDVHEGVNAHRSLRLDKKKGLVAYNHFVGIDEGSPYKGKGFELFAAQVEQLREIGVKELRCHAAGDAELRQVDPQEHNGYYTWPRLGYNAPLTQSELHAMPKAIRQRLPRSKPTMLDLYETKEGRDYWRDHGGPKEMTFDLSEGSRSLAVLAAYQKEREARR